MMGVGVAEGQGQETSEEQGSEEGQGRTWSRGGEQVQACKSC